MQLFFQGVFLLVGTVMGAGIFALPFSFSLSGLIPGILGMGLLAVVMIVLNLFYLQVIISAKGDHQLAGYTQKFLGKKWAKLALVINLFSLNAAVLAYIVLGREFLALVFAQLPSFWHSLCFWLWLFLLFWQGFHFLVKVESFFVAGLVLLILLICFLLSRFINLSNFSLIGSRPFFFWGPTLFALTGFSVIPEVEEVLREKRKLLPKVIIVGGLIPFLVYLLFSLTVWGISGTVTTVDALSGLVVFSPLLVRLGALVGLLALTTSYLSLANIIKETYFRDLKIESNLAKFLAVIPSLIGVILPAQGFIKIISLTGTVALAVAGVLISLMFIKVKPKYRWVAWLMVGVFLIGLLTTIG